MIACGDRPRIASRSGARPSSPLWQLTQEALNTASPDGAAARCAAGRAWSEASPSAAAHTAVRIVRAAQLRLRGAS